MFLKRSQFQPFSFLLQTFHMSSLHNLCPYPINLIVQYSTIHDLRPRASATQTPSEAILSCSLFEVSGLPSHRRHPWRAAPLDLEPRHGRSCFSRAPDAGPGLICSSPSPLSRFRVDHVPGSLEVSPCNFAKTKACLYLRYGTVIVCTAVGPASGPMNSCASRSFWI